MHRNLYITLAIILGVFSESLSQLNPMTNYLLTNPSNNQLGVSAVFDQSTTNNVTLDNAILNLIVPSGYHSPILTNTWTVEVFVDEAALVNFCGVSATGFSYYQIAKQSNQGLGTVSAFVPEPLTVISFSGTSSLPVEGLTFPIPNPLQSCLNAFATNTSSIQWGPNPTAFVGLSDIPVTPQSILLPIYLHTFSAEKLGERSVKLDWKTSSEINSSHFEIQRSTDGLEWTYLGDVAAAGNSTTTRTYDFIDDKLPLGRTKNQIFYYRLRMVDQDGAFKYSDIRGVNFNINDRGDISIYPNPAAQFFNLDLTGIDFSIEEKATVYIYDMSGKLVRQKDIIGSGIEPFSVAELPAEAYNVIIRHGDQQYSKRVIVTK
jgi:hypothetical protein